MPGTGITLSDRFGGLNPWKLSSVEEEFRHKPNSNLSLSDILKLKTLAITVNESKSGKPTEDKSKNYTTTSLHKLFSQKSTGKEARTDRVKNKKSDVLDGKKKVPQRDTDKSEKTSTVKPGDKLNKGEAPAAEPKQTDKLSNGSVNPPQKGPVTSHERPRDPRLLYGRGSYGALAKKSDSVTKSDSSECPGKSQNQESVSKSLHPNKLENAKYPVKKPKKSFGESLTAANGVGLEAAGKKSDGDKTIQVVKRNAVTKQITGVVQLTAKRKPLQTNNPNKPSEAGYKSSHNALQRIAEAKKAEEAAKADASSAAVVTPQALKGILKKNITSDVSGENSEKPKESAQSSSEVETLSKSSQSEEEKPKDALKKQRATAKKHGKTSLKGSTAGAKLKSGVRNRKVSKTAKEANIVLKLSILPTIDNGKLNLTLVSSSEDDQDKSSPKKQKENLNLPLSIQPDLKSISLPEIIDSDKPTQITVTDEELKKGSPIQVRISSGTNNHSPKKSPVLNKSNTLINGEASVCNSVASVEPPRLPGGSPLKASTHVSDDAHTSVEAFGHHSSVSKSISGIASSNLKGHPWISDKRDGPRTGQGPTDSQCLYTTAGHSAAVSSQKSVVEVKDSRPIPVSYVYGTVASSNKNVQGLPPTPQVRHQTSKGTAHSPNQQSSPTSEPCTIPQSNYQGSILPNHEPSMEAVKQVTLTDTSGAQSTEVCVTGSSAKEVHEVSSISSRPSPKINHNVQQTSDCRPISVVIQQNAHKVHKVTTKETGSKPLHRTLTAIARASEAEQPTFAGSDNFEVVDMDLSTPSRCASTGINEKSNFPDASHPGNGESSKAVPSSLTSSDGENMHSNDQNSQTSGEKHSEADKSDGEGRSKSDKQQIQVSHWTTYLHEDTNSPMKSAFGSKQSFTEALSSLQETMQKSDHTSSPETVKDVMSPPKEMTSIPKEPSPSSSLEPTCKIGTDIEKSPVPSQPKETIATSSANQVMQHVPKVAGNASQLDMTRVPDVPRSDTDTTTENSSVQNTVNMKPTDSLISPETGKSPGNETSQSNDVSVCDETKDVPAAKATRPSETEKRHNLNLEKDISVALEETLKDASHVSPSILRHRGFFENTLRRSESPGTPVEDEHMDHHPFSPMETICYTVQESRNDHPETEEGCRSLRLEEKTRDAHTDKEINHHGHSGNHRKHRDQLNLPRQSDKNINQRSRSPRYHPTSNVYMRELSSVSDISMGDDYEGGPCQEALEPLLVRGSSRDSREEDLEDYPRDDISESRREFYDNDREYSDRDFLSQRENRSCYTDPASITDRNGNEKRAYAQHYHEERDHRFDSPDRPTHGFREEQKHWTYERTDSSPPRRDTGQFQIAPPNLQIVEQMTAVQALQMQINAAVNPAHRAALILALQALTGGPMQSHGETRPQDRMVSDQQSDFRERSDEVSSNRSYDDSVRDGPSNRKVEFTVVLRDDDEKLLRKDKRGRMEDHSRVQRHSCDSDERYPNPSSQHHHESKYKHNGEARTEYSRQDGHRKDRVSSHDLSRNIHVERTKSESSEKENDVERRKSSKRKHNKSSPEKCPKKQKKSIEKKSKKKYKDFHGRPLIKDRTNKTDPHSIPLENEDGGDDPRRSVTPDPDCSPKQLQTLIWPPTPKQSPGISKKHKHKEKKRLKSVAVVPGSVETNSMQEETVGKKSSSVSSAGKLDTKNAKGCSEEVIMHTEEIGDKDVRLSSDGKEKPGSTEVLAERRDIEDRTAEQTVEASVDETRQENVSSTQSKVSLSGEDVQDNCTTLTSPTIDQSETKRTKAMDSTSSEFIRDKPSSEDRNMLNASEESATPIKSPLGGKKKRKSPDSRKYNRDDDEFSPKQSPYKRKLSERSPERHRSTERQRIHRHSDSERTPTRHKRKYHAESGSDIDDSDREHSQDERNKLKRSGHFSRFTRGWDWKSKSQRFRHRFVSRERTSFSHRYKYRKFLYSGNLGKPYGNQRTDTYLRPGGKPSLYAEFRGKAYRIDIMKEIKNSPSISMADLGFETIVPWKDVHAGLADIRTKMLAVERSSRQVRKASSALLVDPMQKVHKGARDALQCIMDNVSSRIPYDRREMYLHRRKYEILMADIRIHAEVLGKLIPTEQEEALLAEFIPNTTGIPRIDPVIELKVMKWLKNMDHSGMLMAWKEVFHKKFERLQKKVDEILIKRRERWGWRRYHHADSLERKRKHESGSDRSPDTTGLDSGYHRISDHPDSESSPEVTSCPEMGSSTPETRVQARPEPYSEIRLPTYMQNCAGFPPTSPSTSFKNPPEPVRKLLSSSEGLEGMLIPMPTNGGGDASFFNLVDNLGSEDRMHDNTDQCSQPGPSRDLPTDFVLADSSSIDVNKTPVLHGLSPDCSDIPNVSHTSATPPCTSSSFVDSHKPSSAPVSYPHLAKFYTSRVQRFASRTRMSPEAVFVGNDLLSRNAGQNSNQSKIQLSLSSSEGTSSQPDATTTKSQPKSLSYSKKRHFLEKFQSDGHDSVKEDTLKQPVASKIIETNLNLMYDEFDKSCLVEENSNIESHGKESSPSSFTTHPLQTVAST